jgi:hypothetical protein
MINLDTFDYIFIQSVGASVLKHQISWKYGVRGSSGGSNPPLEVQIYLWRSNPAQGAQIELLGTQIQLWRLKSSPGDSNPALEAQIQLWKLKSSSGGSNPAMDIQI